MKIKEKGFSILEVIIAMLVVGLGISMSLSMMQLSSKQSETANFRTIALYQAKDIISRMRENNLAANKYIFGSNNYAGWKRPATLSPIKDCSAGCTAEDISNNDLNEWLNNVSILLPGGRASILKDGLNLPESEYIVLIMWTPIIQEDDNGFGISQGIQNQSLQIRFTL